MILISVCIVSIIQVIVISILSMSNIKLWIELKAIKGSTHQIVMPTQTANALFEVQDDSTKKSVADSFSDYVGIT